MIMKSDVYHMGDYSSVGPKCTKSVNFWKCIPEKIVHDFDKTLYFFIFYKQYFLNFLKSAVPLQCQSPYSGGQFLPFTF